MRNIYILIISIALIAGCHQTELSRDKPMQWQRTELGFGFGMKDGSEISEAQWQKFVTDEMTPRFPAGLSIFDTHGQWRDPSGKIVRENSRMVVIYCPATEENERKIEEIRQSYVKQFEQDAVMRVDEPVSIRF